MTRPLYAPPPLRATHDQLLQRQVPIRTAEEVVLRVLPRVIPLVALPATAFSGLSHITVSPTPPSNPVTGDIWIDTSGL